MLGRVSSRLSEESEQLAGTDIRVVRVDGATLVVEKA